MAVMSPLTISMILLGFARLAACGQLDTVCRSQNRSGFPMIVGSHLPKIIELQPAELAVVQFPAQNVLYPANHRSRHFIDLIPFAPHPQLFRAAARAQAHPRKRKSRTAPGLFLAAIDTSIHCRIDEALPHAAMHPHQPPAAPAGNEILDTFRAQIALLFTLTQFIRPTQDCADIRPGNLVL